MAVIREEAPWPVQLDFSMSCGPGGQSRVLTIKFWWATKRVATAYCFGDTPTERTRQAWKCRLPNKSFKGFALFFYLILFFFNFIVCKSAGVLGLPKNVEVRGQLVLELGSFLPLCFWGRVFLISASVLCVKDVDHYYCVLSLALGMLGLQMYEVTSSLFWWV